MRPGPGAAPQVAEFGIGHQEHIDGDHPEQHVSAVQQPIVGQREAGQFDRAGSIGPVQHPLEGERGGQHAGAVAVTRDERIGLGPVPGPRQRVHVAGDPGQRQQSLTSVVVTGRNRRGGVPRNAVATPRRAANACVRAMTNAISARSAASAGSVNASYAALR